MAIATRPVGAREAHGAPTGVPTPAGPEALPWRPVLRQALPLWAATRAAYGVVSYFAVLFVWPTHLQGTPHWPTLPVSPAELLARWRIWDAGFYLTIARHNYPLPIDAGFFPLYPLLVRVVVFLLGNPAPDSPDLRWTVAALVVSNGMSLAAFLALGLLAAHEARYVAAAGPVLRVFAAWPLAFFLAAPYTESTFIALAALTLLFARRGQWRAASVCAFLAALTRPTALALVPALAWEYGRHRGWRLAGWRLAVRDLPVGALVLVAVPAAFLLFALYERLHYGDALALAHAQASFRHVLMAPWATALLAWRQFRALPAGGWQQARDLVDVAPVALALVATVAGLRRRAGAHTLYLATLLLLLLATPVVGAQFPDVLVSAGRYLLAAVPLWLDLGRWSARRPWLDHLLTSGGWMLQALFLAYVLGAGWLV